MTAQMKQIIGSGVGTQEPLCLFYSFESPHTPLSYPGRFVRQLSSIVGVLLHVVKRFRHQFAMS
jgi:hypothetical protein